MSIFDEVARARAAPVPVEDATCPDCGGVMVERRNSVSGSPFLGCLKYPRCTGTINGEPEPISGWYGEKDESDEPLRWDIW